MLNYTGEYCEYGEYCNAQDALHEAATVPTRVLRYEITLP